MVTKAAFDSEAETAGACGPARGWAPRMGKSRCMGNCVGEYRHRHRLDRAALERELARRECQEADKL
jgi:hypothetical protein